MGDIQRFHVGERLSETAVHNGTVYLAGQVADDTAADLRGQTDSEVARRLLNVADSRFQPALLAQLKAAGRIEAGYEIPERYRDNTPEALAARLAPHAARLPAFPFGCDLTPDERRGAVRAVAEEVALAVARERGGEGDGIGRGMIDGGVGEAGERHEPRVERLADADPFGADRLG